LGFLSNILGLNLFGFATNLNGWQNVSPDGTWVDTIKGLQAANPKNSDSFYMATNSYADFTYQVIFIIEDGTNYGSAGIIFRSASDLSVFMKFIIKFK
jgi:hypothetical protein